MIKIPQELLGIAEDVCVNGKRRRAKVRTMLSWFGVHRRQEHVVKRIEESLRSLGLQTNPNFVDEFLDNKVYFELRNSEQSSADTLAEISPAQEDMSEVANDDDEEDYEPPLEIRETVTLSISENPTYKVSHFASARKTIISVAPHDDLEHAMTMMVLKGFDQLPVMQGTRKVNGVLSWKSIARSRASGTDASLVNQCMEDAQVVHQEDSLFEAVERVLKHGCVLVRNQKLEISGIITPYDVAKQFRELTEPYLLVGEIERLLRNIIASNFSQHDIQSVAQEGDRPIEDVTDMTFGQYQRLLENPKYWGCLPFKVERRIFVEMLDKVRLARNDVMHFDPEGVEPDRKRSLWEFAKFLQILQSAP